VDGASHEHAFVGGSNERRTCDAFISTAAVFHGGIKALTLLKTTKSGFVGFVKDAFTTLRETNDRIFATAVDATWRYGAGDADYNACYATIRDTILRVFATHDSLAVQQTLYEMGAAALAACDQIDEISLTMPNQHRLLVNLQPFGLENANEVFVPTDEPFGLISGTVAREG
jgi:urate oxidase